MSSAVVGTDVSSSSPPLHPLSTRETERNEGSAMERSSRLSFSFQEYVTVVFVRFHSSYMKPGGGGVEQHPPLLCFKLKEHLTLLTSTTFLFCCLNHMVDQSLKCRS